MSNVGNITCLQMSDGLTKEKFNIITCKYQYEDKNNQGIGSIYTDSENG